MRPACSWCTRRMLILVGRRCTQEEKPAPRGKAAAAAAAAAAEEEDDDEEDSDDDDDEEMADAPTIAASVKKRKAEVRARCSEALAACLRQHRAVTECTAVTCIQKSCHAFLLGSLAVSCQHEAEPAYMKPHGSTMSGVSRA